MFLTHMLYMYSQHTAVYMMLTDIYSVSAINSTQGLKQLSNKITSDVYFGL